MSFLRRMLGGPPEWRVPRGQYSRVAGTSHRLRAIGQLYGRQTLNADVVLTLRREPNNPADPHAVMVLIESTHVGYLPRYIAEEWSGRLAELEAAGYAVRAEGRLRYSWEPPDRQPEAYVDLYMDSAPPATA